MKPYVITVKNQIKCSAVAAARLREVVRFVLAAGGVNSARINVMIVGHDDIRVLKHRYFHRDVTTDVISFDVSDEMDDAAASSAEYDIVVNAEMAREVAQKRNSSFMAELSLYVVHGLLHQLGYDDGTAGDAKRMHRMEDRLLEELGFGKVYYGKD